MIEPPRLPRPLQIGRPRRSFRRESSNRRPPPYHGGLERVPRRQESPLAACVSLLLRRFGARFDRCLTIPESPRGTPNLSPKPVPTISLTEPVVPGAVRADPGAAGHMLGFEVSRPSGITAWPPLVSFMRMSRQSGLILTRLSGLAGSRPSDGRGRSRGMPVDLDEKERLLRLWCGRARRLAAELLGR
jgi:hypothetical protein